MKILFFVALLVALTFAAPLLKVAEPVDGEYIIVFHDNSTDLHVSSHMNKMFNKRDNSSVLLHQYTHVLRGYAAQLHPTLLQNALADPNVKYIEQNGIVRATACVTQTNAQPWGIKRIALEKPDTKATTYNYPDTAGAGVTAYIIDTGIYVANVDFEGRATFAFKATASWSDTDANGHGTHVASTVGGKNYGVAKKVTIKAVKVLGDNGSGTNAGVIAGVDFVRQDSSSTRKVANMSLGGGLATALNDAVNNAVNAGVAMSVAAGNDNRDAKNYSPASATQAICVGSTAEGSGTDTRSTFSNYGSLVTVFAPGTSILAAWIGNTGATNTISGTSMASPHVCGVTALLMANGVSGKDMKSNILSTSKTGLINLICTSANNAAECNQSQNRFLYSKC